MPDKKRYHTEPERYKEYSQAWYAKNRGYVADRNMRKQYGIGFGDYDAMLEAQGGRCALCHSCEPGDQGRYGIQRFSIDHDHQTGRIRALLCNTCNRMLGLAGDDPSVLRRAAAYLEEHA